MIKKYLDTVFQKIEGKVWRMKEAIWLFLGVPLLLIPYNDWGKVGRSVEKTRFNQNLEENPGK